MTDASDLADQRGLGGLARETLINWAARAEENHRWTETQLKEMFSAAGLEFIETTTAVGPGFARFARGKL